MYCFMLAHMPPYFRPCGTQVLPGLSLKYVGPGQEDLQIVCWFYLCFWFPVRRHTAADSLASQTVEDFSRTELYHSPPGERMKASWLEDHPDVVRLLAPCEDQHRPQRLQATGFSRCGFPRVQ